MDEVYSIAELRMRSSLVVRRPAVNAKVATVMGSFLASSDTVESEGRQMEQYWITYIKKFKKYGAWTKRVSGRAPKFKKMMDVKSPKRFSNFYLVSLTNGLASKQFREKATPITNFFV